MYCAVSVQFAVMQMLVLLEYLAYWLSFKISLILLAKLD